MIFYDCPLRIEICRKSFLRHLLAYRICQQGNLYLLLFVIGSSLTSGQKICAQTTPSTKEEKVSPWGTFRANSQRTGNIDGKSGPKVPQVDWFYRTQEHCIASPVIAGETILFPAVGGFNRPVLLAFSLLPNSSNSASTPLQQNVKPLWTKSTPTFRLPLVCSPAVVGDYLILGDGMHQTDGGMVQCLPIKEGFSHWSYAVPGKLVHLEGSPTVLGKNVFVGAGSAGVICLEWQNATYNQKQYSLTQLETLQKSRWQQLQDQYKIQKKKDPDFAVPPGEDQLVGPAPKMLWQMGKERWHVDAPINASDNRVFVCTAYLDKEMLGEKAIHCLDAQTGKIIWSTPLKYNPWGGATIVGDTVLVPTSSIGYYYQSLKGCKGELYALDRKTGKVKWKKDYPGGLLAAVAAQDGLAVFTATDGKVRAVTVQEGERRLLYDAKSPFFAPPAIVNRVAYVGDTSGIIHALDLKSGQRIWQLSLKDQPIQSPGMIYGGLVVHGGKIYGATSNLEGPNAQKSTAVFCISEKK